MADPRSSDSLDTTLPLAESESAPVAPSSSARASDATLDFADWTWHESKPPAQTLPLTQSEPTATSDSAAEDAFDETLALPTAAMGRKDAPVPDELEQTLLHPPITAKSPKDMSVTEELEQTLLHPPVPGSLRKVTHIPIELEQTLVHGPDISPRRGDTPPPPTIDETLALPSKTKEDAESTDSGHNATPVKPTAGPAHQDTRVPEQRLDTQPPKQEETRDPHATVGEQAKPVTEVKGRLADTEPRGGGEHGQPTGGKSRKAPPKPAAGDRYEILGTLGRGGMGVVYKARDTVLNRLVALKMILSGAHASPETLMRFRIEAEAVAKMQHPHIVQIFDTGERDGHPYFSLEYLDGGSLHQRLEGAVQPPKRAAALVEVLARAIHYAHLRGIVHRDMKPANVLLAADGTPKITDFGLAKQLDEEDSGQTGADSILGTPTYMAPEQAAGRTKEIGPAADIYALGVILYEMLTGRPPFRGKTIMDTLQQVQFTEPIQPRRLQPNAPLDLQTICLKCLNKEPNKRYASAEALADDLRAYLENRPIQARPTPALERVYKWMCRRPVDAALVGVCILTFLGLIYGVVQYVRYEKEMRQQAEVNVRQAEVNFRQAEANAELDRIAKKTAQDAQQRAETDAATIRTEKAEAVKQRGIALNNFDQAKAAVDELTNLAQVQLADKPGLEKERNEMLNRVVQFYDEFVKTYTDPALALQRGQAYRRRGDIQQALGKTSDAADSYRQARDSYLALAEKDARNQYTRRELGEVYLNLWTVLTDQGKDKEADKAIAQSHETFKSLHADYPDNGIFLRDFSGCLNDRGIQQLRAKKYGDAQASFQEALDYLGKAKPEDAQDRRTLLELAKTNCNLATLFMNWPAAPVKPDARQAATLHFETALATLKPLVEKYPARTEYAQQLGTVYTDYGILKQKTDPASAEAMYREAVALFDDLNKKYAKMTDFQHLLALNQSNLGDMLGQRRQFNAARVNLQAAATALAALVEGFPSRSIYRLEQARNSNRLGVVLAASGEQELARQSWELAQTRLDDLLGDKPGSDDYRQELKRTIIYLIGYHDRQARDFGQQNQWPNAASEVAMLIELREKLQKWFPEDAENKVELASTRLAYASTLLQTRNYLDAAKVLTLLVKQHKDLPPVWGKLHEAALQFERCLELLDADATLSPGRREQLRNSYITDTLLLLRLAIDRNENFTIRPDDFKTLRPNEDFQQMLLEMGRKKNKVAGS